MYKKAWCTCKVVVLPCQAIAYLTFLSPPHLKLPIIYDTLWSVKNRIFSGQIQLLLLIASQTVFRLIGSSLASFLVNRVENKSFFCTLRVIVRENRTVPKDWGQPISFIFSAFKTKLIRLTLVTLWFSGVSLPRLTTPLVFGQGKL